MGPALHGIDHVALTCFDLKATERFYGELLGLAVERTSGVSAEWGGRTWRLAGFALPNGTSLDFFEIEGEARPAPRGPLDSVRHVALAVPSRADLEAWRKKLEANGHPVLEEQDHGAGRHSLYFSDPNGHSLELTCRAAR